MIQPVRGPSGRLNLPSRLAGLLLLPILCCWTGSASAQARRDFCPDRPGLGTPACTIDRGHAAVEIGLADWTLDRGSGERTDTVVLGDMLVRYGLSDRIEAQIGWQALGLMRHRDAAGGVDRSTGVGDVRLALRANLLNPDGSGLSVALMPQLTMATGDQPLGDGDWSAALLLPLSYELGEGLQIAATGEIETAPDEAGSGHHLAYGGVLGLEAPLAQDLGAAIEIAARRDKEPGEHRTELLGGLSLAWSARESLQFDLGVNLGLNGNAPDLELYVGIAKRF
ncbi:transporter [Sphingomonas parva]|uniref:Transporter n=1 Tax=Sphingomonas parva TaxID=2555898 RepID=A0A4Y8ZTL0_9SPHN|nr:transporter [Sphingomonas parva]TFI59341.1 transporter [Sphingomonas parva]